MAERLRRHLSGSTLYTEAGMVGAVPLLRPFEQP
jgi:hypothetical protein